MAGLGDFGQFLGDIAFPTAMQRMRQREAQGQVQQLLGQQGQQYQGGGQGMLADIPATGLLGGQIAPKEFGAKLMAIPGYEQVGAGMMKQFTPQPQGPAISQLDPSKFTPQSLQQFAQTQDYGVLQPIHQAAPGTQKPLGKESAMWISPAGEPANPMMTVAQATQAGYRPQTTEKIKAIQATQAFAPMLGKVVEYGFGQPEMVEGKEEYPSSLFPKKGEDWAITKGFKSLWQSGQAATGGNPQLSGYKSTQDAMISNLARIGGQTGVLTDPDVERVQSMMPIPYVTEEAEARQKFKDIASLLASKGMSKEQMAQAGIPQWALGGAKKAPYQGAQRMPAPMTTGAPATGSWVSDTQQQGQQQQSAPWLDYQR